MNYRDSEKADEAIEALLRSEPMRSVPAGFGRRVKARVTLAALIDRERLLYRYLRAATVTIGLLVFCGLLLVAVFPRALEMAIEYFVPGGAGYFDYLVSLTRYGGYSGGDLLLLLAAVSAVLAVGLAAAWAYAPQRRSAARRSWSPMGRS